MGEYAEMMLDGTMCQSCGEFINSDNGYPTSCRSCRSDEKREAKKVASGLFFVVEKDSDVAKAKEAFFDMPFNAQQWIKDKAGNHMLRLFYDPNPSSDWARQERMGTIVCKSLELKKATKKMLKQMKLEKKQVENAVLANASDDDWIF